MTCNTVYTSALALIGEAKHSTGTTTYAARAPQLLTVIFLRLAKFAKQFGNSEIYPELLVIETLDYDFPFDTQLFPVCAYMLASMLIFDELPELSEKLDTEAKKVIEELSKQLGSTEAIREVYS